MCAEAKQNEGHVSRRLLLTRNPFCALLALVAAAVLTSAFLVQGRLSGVAAAGARPGRAAAQAQDAEMPQLVAAAATATAPSASADGPPAPDSDGAAGEVRREPTQAAALPGRPQGGLLGRRSRGLPQRRWPGGDWSRGEQKPPSELGAAAKERWSRTMSKTWQQTKPWLSVADWKVGTQVSCTRDVVLHAKLIVERGAQGVVRGPSAMHPSERIAVVFKNHLGKVAMLNLLPSELLSSSEILLVPGEYTFFSGN